MQPPAFRAVGEVAPEECLIPARDLDVLELRLSAPGADPDRAGSGLGSDRGRRHCDGQHDVPPVLAEHLLHVIRRDAIDARAVEVNQVRVPLLIVHVGKQRRIGRHDNHIGIALHARHEGGLPYGSAQVALTAALHDRVFPHINLVCGAVVGVILGGIGDKELRRGVIVLIHDLQWFALRSLERLIGEEMHLRMLRFDGVVEEGVTLVVSRPAVFVPDFHILQVERGAMPILRPHSPPRAGDRAIGVFDRIQCVLDKLAHLIQGHVLLVRHAAVDDEEWLRPQILAHL